MPAEQNFLVTWMKSVQKFFKPAVCAQQEAAVFLRSLKGVWSFLSVQ